MHYNSAGGWLKPIDCIQDNALIIGVVVLSELATCSIRISNFKFHVVSTFIRPKSHPKITSQCSSQFWNYRRI
jgi:hypothetical protein